MGKIEDLAKRYRAHILAPWQRNLAGAQKTIFVVYPKSDERKLRARMELFELATTAGQHHWRLLDITAAFARWMAQTDYRDSYFEEPESISMKLESEFVQSMSELLQEALVADDIDENSVVAIIGVASLFGFTRVSEIINKVINDVQGRLLVFFPGEFENNNYRLLDARDGWNYLAVPITLHNGVHD